MLSVHIRKALGSFTLDLALEAANERCALLGASGSGKSMALKAIAGIVTPDEGRINEELPAAISGQQFSINYNVKYLLDALKVMDGEQVRLRFTGPNTPGVILPEGEEQPYLYLLLPIRVGR